MNTVNEQEFREYVDAAFKKHIECKNIPQQFIEAARIDFNEGALAALHYIFGLLFEYDNVQK